LVLQNPIRQQHHQDVFFAVLPLRVRLMPPFGRAQQLLRRLDAEVLMKTWAAFYAAVEEDEIVHRSISGPCGRA